MEDNWIKNRKRCLTCQYYGKNVCPLLAEADVGRIDTCILEYPDIKAIKEGSLDEFVFYRNSKEYLSYLGFIRKNKLPETGAPALTLTGGFSSCYPGKLVKVIKIDDHQIFINDLAGDDKDAKYCVPIGAWYEKLFILI